MRIYYALAVRYLLAFTVSSCYHIATAQSSYISPDDNPPKYGSENNIYREVKIGEVVPDFNFELANSPLTNTSLYSFRGKFLLLDFWATWCSSCIYEFPEIDALQKKFGAKSLQVLLVNSKSTRDTKSKIIDFFSKRRNRLGQSYSLPTIINDTITDILFPHEMIPHYALIDDKGILQAITSSDQLTEKNILDFTNGNTLNLTIKKDIKFDPQQPLFVNGNGGSNEKYIYRSFLTGYVEGLSGSSGTIMDNRTKLVTRMFFTNVSAFMLYTKAYPEIGYYPSNRVILSVSNTEKYTPKKKEDWQGSWRLENSYCYEMITPPISIEKTIEYLKDDLKRSFNLKVYTEKRIVNCYVMKYDGKSKTSFSKDVKPESNIYTETIEEKFIRNLPTLYLANFLNSIQNVPVLDETNLKENISIQLPVNPGDFNALKKCLKKYGFSIVEEKRELEFVILSDH